MKRILSCVSLFLLMFSIFAGTTFAAAGDITVNMKNEFGTAIAPTGNVDYVCSGGVTQTEVVFMTSTITFTPAAGADCSTNGEPITITVYDTGDAEGYLKWVSSGLIYDTTADPNVYNSSNKFTLLVTMKDELGNPLTSSDAAGQYDADLSTLMWPNDGERSPTNTQIGFHVPVGTSPDIFTVTGIVGYENYESGLTTIPVTENDSQTTADSANQSSARVAALAAVNAATTEPEIAAILSDSASTTALGLIADDLTNYGLLSNPNAVQTALLGGIPFANTTAVVSAFTSAVNTQKAIEDATDAVVAAETAVLDLSTQELIIAAQGLDTVADGLVSALSDGAVKIDLTGRLTATQGAIDGAQGILFTGIFDTIDATLEAMGIINNISTCGATPTACVGLSFEKVGFGKITFPGSLDLTSTTTVATLQALDTGIDFQNGIIRFDATSSDAFVDLGGSLEMYGLIFTSEPTIFVDDVIATVGEGNDVNNISYNSETGVLTFTANHFSTFTVEETPSILSAIITSGNEITIVYSEPVTGLVGDYTDLIFNGSDPRSVVSFIGDGTNTVVLTFDGAPVNTGAVATIDINVPPTSVQSVATGIDLPQTNNYAISDGQTPVVTALVNEGLDYTLSFTPSGPRPTLHSATLNFGEELSAESKTDIENALSAGSDKILGFAWGTGGNIGKLRISYEGDDEIDTATFTNDVYASFEDLAGNSTTSLLIDSVLSEDQVEPDEAGEATLSTTTPEIVITDPTATTTIIIDSEVEDPTIDVSTFIGTNGTGTIPAIIIDSEDADVEIPDDTEITSASTTWDGIIHAPTVTTVTLPVESGVTKTFSTAIELGFSGVELTFSKAVRILIVGQAGKRAGYTRDGGTTFTEITSTCSADTQVAGDALGAGAECKKDVGSDLVIWTKHFTTFATYTQTTNPVSSGGGGAIWHEAPIVVATAVSTSSVVATTNLNTVSVAPATVTSKPESKFTLDLQVGSEGTEVAELQKLLVTEGHLIMPAGVAYGYFGNATKAALIKYQIAKGITPASGYFGSKTRGVLNASKLPVQIEAKQNIASMTLKQLVQMLLDIGAIASDKVDAAKKLILTL